METLHYKNFKKPADGGGNEGEEEGVVQTEVKQEGMDGHSLDGEHRCYVKVCSPDDMCIALPRDLRWFKTVIPFNRSVSNKTCLLFDQAFYVSIEIWV